MVEGENGFVSKDDSEFRIGSGRRHRPPPADFAPFDSSETRCKRRNVPRLEPGANGLADGIEADRSSLVTWFDIPGELKMELNVF